MLDANAINKSFRQVVRALLNLPVGSVRPANDNSGVGTAPFATVLVMSCESIGQDSRTLSDSGVAGQLTETIEGQRHVIVDLQFFRDNANSNASRMKGLLQTSTGRSLMKQNGLGLIRCSSATDLTQVINTLDEARAHVQVEFYALSSESSTVSTFASVAIEVQTETQSSNSEVQLDS